MPTCVLLLLMNIKGMPCLVEMEHQNILIDVNLPTKLFPFHINYLISSKANLFIRSNFLTSIFTPLHPSLGTCHVLPYWKIKSHSCSHIYLCIINPHNNSWKLFILIRIFILEYFSLLLLSSGISIYIHILSSSWPHNFLINFHSNALQSRGREKCRWDCQDSPITAVLHRKMNWAFVGDTGSGEVCC